ncbi:hypothetical protein FQN54_001586 [Arachnomyces sp. PD_36]|nr:hypothetical protein FQN54_001586 [Arachnomyces sp. PD_36]
MASYEVEHSTESLQTQPSSTNTRPRRPDLSTFFATLSEITPSPAETRTRPHAVPVPGDVSAAYRTLAEAFNFMRREGGGGGVDTADIGGQGDEELSGDSDLLGQMIQLLLRDADMPPREIEGVSEEFCDVLERIPSKSLKPTQSCPICNNPFLEDPYPLVVRLPCHTSHLFDLECVRPWLRLRGTCPLDRTDFGNKEREKERERLQQLERKRQEDAENGEDDWDGMYG